MPLVCISCRDLVVAGVGRSARSCSNCGGEIVSIPGAWLEWEGPNSRGRLLLSGTSVSVGRRSSNQVVLEDSQASRHHAVLRKEQDGWWVVDCDSQNGTILNGRTIKTAQLRDGDVLQIGEHRLYFHQDCQGEEQVTLVPGPGPEIIEEQELSAAVLPDGDIPEDGQQLKESYRRLSIAYQLLSSIGRESDERKLLEKILTFAIEQLPAERAVAVVREEEGAPLVPMVSFCRNPGQGPPNIPDTILRAAVTGRRAVLSADALLDERFRSAASVVEAEVRSAMCVPLIGRNYVLGALYLDTSSQHGAFTHKDLVLLSTIADQTAVVLEQNRLEKQLREEARRREQLSRFLARELVNEVMRQGLSLSGEAKVGEVAVLFCDIRGFCALSEKLLPSELLGLLNRFFHAMAEVVFREQGMLDKFIGDAVMAVWGAPIRRPGDPYRALRAGMGMLRAMEDLNRQSRSRGEPELQVGIGLHYGPALVGTIGSSLRMEYTVMGDTVNLAARICQLAGPGQFLVSAQAVAAASEGGSLPRVERQPASRIKGRSQPVHLYRVAEF